MLRQFNCLDKEFLCRDRVMALESKSYVTTQNCESQKGIVATKISMPRQINV